MKNFLLPLGAIILLSTGFFTGRISRSTNPEPDIDEKADSKRSHRGRALSHREYRESPNNPNNLRKAGGVKKGMAFVLDENDPVQRSLKIHQLLEEIDASKWRELVEGMIVSNGETGRNADYQMRSIITRIGQVDGQAALEGDFPLRAKGDPRNHLLYGWAMKDPDAAWAWAKKFNAENPDRAIEIYGSAFGGLTRTHPEKATQLLKEMPDEEWDEAIGGYVRNIIRSETLDQTDVWLKDVLASNRPEELKRKAIETVSSTVGTAARNLRAPEKIAQWYDEFGRHADTEHFSMATKLIRNSGDRNGANAAKVITDLQRRGIVLDQPQLLQITHSLKPERRTEARDWLVQNGHADLATWFSDQ